MIRDGIALFLIDKLMDANPPAGSFRGRLLEKLAMWKEGFEEEHYPIGVFIENTDEWWLVGDGFGSAWCDKCGGKSMAIVRPGKAQCPYCD